MIRAVLKKSFSTAKSTVEAAEAKIVENAAKTIKKKALLLPSKIPIFPFQSYVSVINEEDMATIKKLGFHQAISATKIEHLDELSQEVKDSIARSRDRVQELLEKRKAEDGDPKSESGKLKAKRGVPAIQKTDPKHLLGQGLAMTVDESFKEVYLPSDTVNFHEFLLNEINSIDEVTKTATLANLRLSNQRIQSTDRFLMTLEGKDIVQIESELGAEDFTTIFQENIDHRVNKMKDRLEMLKKFQASNNSNDFYDNHEIQGLQFELEKLTEKPVNVEEMLELFQDTKLRVVEYSTTPRDLFATSETPLLRELLKLIWKEFKALEENSSLVFTEVPYLDEVHELNLICAYLAKDKIFDSGVHQFLMEIQNPVEKAQIILDLVANFKEEYINTWKSHAKGSDKAQTSKEAKQQIDELYEYLKKIQQESSSPIKKMVVKKVREALEEKVYPSAIREIIHDELQKFEDLSESFPEFQTIKDFLELVSELPYGVNSEDNFDVKKAKEILDKDHFGMEKVKERILEFIAVAKLKNEVKGKNLLLVGPPGVGKTSIASSIAECLGREFIRISLGGESDVAILKGHRKTYIGAYPGKLVQAFKTAQTENPVILLDEVDKISPGYRGNLQDTLLEVLDPQQNHQFRDNFLEAPLDLSKVLFVCSANLLETITPPVLDRLEVIELSGYTTEEKMEITRQHLLPTALEKSGIEGYDVEVTDEGLVEIINSYARESGVRSLEKKIRRICEKVCKKIVENPELDTFEINAANAREYLGVPTFSKKRLYPKEMPDGISIGLGYNLFGGSVLFIETSKSALAKDSQDVNAITEESPGASEGSETGQNIAKNSSEDEKNQKAGAVIFTGSLGDVMKESVQIAHTFAKHLCFDRFETDFLEKNDIHIHFPEGASKKDGPSAGITITSAFVSLATGKPISGEIGMTGEISLNGKILKIGGLREKILAARREGLNQIIVPYSNRIDVDELSENITEGITFHYVKHYNEACDILFGGLREKVAA